MQVASEFRLFLVEDDSELANFVADFLSSDDLGVTIEARGDRAVARIKSEPFA